MRRIQLKTVAFWVATICGPASFVIGGVIGLVGQAESVQTLAHLGYPSYFGTLLGAWKLLGALAIVAPRLPQLKEWAYAGFLFDLTAAATSHAAVGDAPVDVALPLVFLALVIASWALRPESRKLAGRASVGSRARTTAGPVAVAA